MRGKFRWKIISVLTLVGALAGTGWFLLHRYQMRRMNHAFLEQSVRAEDAGHTERAARFLRQYLLINRDDIDALARYGVLLDKLANSPRARNDALTAYELVLAQDPQRLDIRKRAAHLAMKVNTDAALRHLSALQDAGQDDAETDFLIGQCYGAKKE